jgi:hypothetical protein
VGNESGPGGAPGNEDEFDRRWRELAERLSAEMPPSEPSVTSGFASLDGLDGLDGPDGPDSAAGPPPDAGAWVSEPIALGGPRDWEEREPPEEHFVPPEPPPVTASEPLLVIAWTAVVGGLLTLAAYVVLQLDLPVIVPRACAVAVAAGIGLLLWRMPHKREDPEDPGAQV